MSNPTGEQPTPRPDDNDPAAPRPADLPEPPDQPEPTPDATPADDEPFVALLKRHFPRLLGHPGRWLHTHPNPARPWIGLSNEDAHQEALIRLLKVHRERSAPGQTFLNPRFIARSLRNAEIDLSRHSKRESKALAEAASQQPTGDVGQPDDQIDAQLRAAVLEHRWHLKEQYQQVVDAVFDPTVPTQKAIAERVGRVPGWVSKAIEDIASIVRQCLMDGECPRKEQD